MTKTLQGNDHNSVRGIPAKIVYSHTFQYDPESGPKALVEKAIADVFSAVEAIEVKEVGVEVNFVSGSVIARILTYDDRSVSSTKAFEVEG